MESTLTLDELKKYKQVILQLSATQDSIVEICKQYLKDPTSQNANDFLIEYLFNVDFYTDDSYKEMISNKLKECLID